MHRAALTGLWLHGPWISEAGLPLACVAGGLSRCGKQRHGRHFVLVADGRIRASDKIKGEGVGVCCNPQPLPHPLPPHWLRPPGTQAVDYRKCRYAWYHHLLCIGGEVHLKSSTDQTEYHQYLTSAAGTFPDVSVSAVQLERVVMIRLRV